MTTSKAPTAKPLTWLKNRFNPLKIILTVLLFFLPLYPKFPLAEVEGTYVAIRVDDVVVGISLLVWLVWQIKSGWPIRKNKVTRFFFVYWLIGFLSLLSAVFVSSLVNPKIALLHWLRRIEYMGLFFLATDAFRFFSLAEFSVIVFLVSAGVFAYGMGQKYFGLPVVSTMNEEFSKGALLYLDKWTRISSTFAGHYDLAAWLVIILSLIPALVSASKKKVVKILLLLAGGINLYLLILTASRISFVAYLIGITITILLLRHFRWLPIVLILSLFFGFQSKELNARLASTLSVSPFLQNAARQVKKTALRLKLTPKTEVVPTSMPTPTLTAEPTITTVTEGGPEEGRGAVETPITGKVILREARTWPKPEEVAAAAERSSQIRFQVEWPRAINAFLKNPLLGTGFSSLGLATDNDFLRVAGETGVLGIMAFLLIFIFLIRQDLSAIIKGNPILAGFIGLTFGLWANAIFIDVFEASKVAFYFWMLAGIGNTLSKSEKQILKKK